MQLELAYHMGADGGATVSARGELDIATADQAYAYLRDVVDGLDGALTVNLGGLTFCDAAGLGVLARLAGHARLLGRELKLAAARPSLLRIMRITGMDEAFPEVHGTKLSMITWPRQVAAGDLGRARRDNPGRARQSVLKYPRHPHGGPLAGALGLEMRSALHQHYGRIAPIEGMRRT
jgi:anti-sigma B factor antagonist